ncbi:MAG: PEGA domain-containing protein [Vicinamibacterales bacterium]
MNSLSMSSSTAMALALFVALPTVVDAQVRRHPPEPSSSGHAVVGVSQVQHGTPITPTDGGAVLAQRTARPRGSGGGGQSAGRSGGGQRARSGDSGQSGTVRRRPPSDNGPRAGGNAGRSDGAVRVPSRRYDSANVGQRVAVPRAGRPPSAIPGWGAYPRSYRPANWYRTYYRPSYWYWAPLGWGVGYWSYYDPFYSGAYGYGYGYGYGGGARYYDDTGSVRLKVTPRQAQVLVDGYFVGVVDDFDGTFQRLRLEEGPHTIQVRLAGFLPIDFPVYVTVDRTITLNGVLEPAP